MNTLSPEMQALKTKLKATWDSGDYGRFASYMEPGALEILRRLPVGPGTRLLDVATGAGQIAIPAARLGARVTGIDIAPHSIAQARARAAAEGLTAQFDEGDAESLPYPDAAFDVVVSLIGAMFAPRPDRVAAELVRVTRPGGMIYMANWTPQGFVGQMFKIIGQAVAASPLMPSPVKWGDEATVRERLPELAGHVLSEAQKITDALGGALGALAPPRLDITVMGAVEPPVPPVPRTDTPEGSHTPKRSRSRGG